MTIGDKLYRHANPQDLALGYSLRGSIRGSMLLGLTALAIPRDYPRS